jgi:hypothetical protein
MQHPFKSDLRNVFRSNISYDDMQRLCHFAWVKKIKSHPPGTYVVYHFYQGGIAVATNALNINNWLVEHGQKPRPPVNPLYVEKVMKRNDYDEKIDNRDSWIYVKKVVKTLPPSEMQRDIWDKYTNHDVSASELATAYNITVPGVYYHVKQYKRKKELTNQ